MEKVLKYRKVLKEQLIKGLIDKKEYKKELKYIRKSILNK
jgi:uncharacterized membrane protein